MRFSEGVWGEAPTLAAQAWGLGQSPSAGRVGRKFWRFLGVYGEKKTNVAVTKHCQKSEENGGLTTNIKSNFENLLKLSHNSINLVRSSAIFGHFCGAVNIKKLL